MSGGSLDHVVYGSGFFVRPDVVATNYHVVKDATQGYVKLVGQEIKLEIAGLAGLDRSNDLALLKLRRPVGLPLKIVDNAALGVGDQIFVVGNPKGLEGTFSAGLVSGIRRDGSDSLLQITAPISPGSSGGPVLDEQGEVVGVAVGGIAEGQSQARVYLPACHLRVEKFAVDYRLRTLYAPRALSGTFSQRVEPSDFPLSLQTRHSRSHASAQSGRKRAA